MSSFAEIAQHGPLKKPTNVGRRATEALECMSDVDLIEPQLESTYPMYKENREKMLAALGAQSGDLIMLTGDKLELRTGADTEILFRQASNVWYLANVNRYDVTLVIDPADGKSMVLLKVKSEREEVFDGPYPPFEEVAKMHDVDEAMHNTELGNLLSSYSGTIYTLDEEALLAQFPNITNVMNSVDFLPALEEARAIKSERELLMLRHSSQVAADAHIKAWEATTLEEPYNNEFVVENAFLSACYSCGLRFQAYIPIIASGPNSATLHYNANNQGQETRFIGRAFVDGDLMLIDAAPETKGYTSDVSRTYPVNGKFTPDQKLVYDIVLNAQKNAMEAFVPGNSWNFVSTVSLEWITKGLSDAGFVQGENEELLEKEVWKTFMPHSLGHSVGLDVHDISIIDGNDAPLVKGHVYTIEPGVYFVDDLLDTAINGENGNLYNAEMIERFRGFGGVRIEDVIAVTVDGNECLSCSTPRETEEIEAIFAGFVKPSSGESSDDSLSTGSIVGIVAASVAFAAFVMMGMYRMGKSAGSKREPDAAEKLLPGSPVV